MAPRGIVAAAVSSVFALRLSLSGIAEAEILVPVTFMVIVVTVTVYGLTSSPLAKVLKVAQSKPQGVLFVGAHQWSRSIAKVIQEKEINVILVDTNRANIKAARLEGMPAFFGSILSEHITDDLDLDGIGRLMALTSNDEANSLAALHMSDAFERGQMYQLPPLSKSTGKESDFSPKYLRARFLFAEGMDYNHLDSLFKEGWVLKSTILSDTFTFGDMQKYYNDMIIPLFSINQNGELFVSTLDEPLEPSPGENVIALVKDTEQKD
jgi:hypothetical protein